MCVHFNFTVYCREFYGADRGWDGRVAFLPEEGDTALAHDGVIEDRFGG
jgi:hypothetical protein